MDHFGIGVAVCGMLETYFRASRGTGRTTSLVDSVKSGDRVVFVDRKQANHAARLFRDRGVDKVDCVVVNPADPSDLFRFDMPRADGRLIFDHVWIEQFYRMAIAKAGVEIDQLQRELSGRGAPHRKTERAAREYALWR